MGRRRNRKIDRAGGNSIALHQCGEADDYGQVDSFPEPAVADLSGRHGRLDVFHKLPCKGLAAKGHQVVVGCRQDSLLYKLLEGWRGHPLPYDVRWQIRQVKLEADPGCRLAPCGPSHQSATQHRQIHHYVCQMASPASRQSRPYQSQMPASAGGRLQALFYNRRNRILDKLQRILPLMLAAVFATTRPPRSTAPTINRLAVPLPLGRACRLRVGCLCAACRPNRFRRLR